ncbi:MAG: hypothetical protein SGPRY_004142, partial [Prymnesium sp.]
MDGIIDIDVARVCTPVAVTHDDQSDDDEVLAEGATCRRSSGRHSDAQESEGEASHQEYYHRGQCASGARRAGTIWRRDILEVPYTLNHLAKSHGAKCQVTLQESNIKDSPHATTPRSGRADMSEAVRSHGRGGAEPPPANGTSRPTITAVRQRAREEPAANLFHPNARQPLTSYTDGERREEPKEAAQRHYAR